MMTRQMLSTVSSGRMPRWRSTRRRIIVGLARRAEGGAGFLRALDRDQAVDDLAALHQQRVHRLVDAVDLGAQIGKRWARRLWAAVRHGRCSLTNGAALIGGQAREIKENIDSNGRLGLPKTVRPTAPGRRRLAGSAAG